jgi:NAD(P)-dependent dehydrogenase (short-subunit alcohol dehydrogenase family)
LGRLQSKVFIVTGGLGAIGSVAARLLAGAGANVVATDISDEGSGELIASLSAQGCEASFFAADLAEEEEARALVDHAVGRFGRLDGAFNNAGIEQPRKPLVELTGDEWARIMRINVQSMFHCVKYQFLAMKDGGSIVNTSSGLGVVGSAHLAAYVASKHAVCGLTRSAAVDGGPLGIRVNAVLPGVVKTPMHERVYGAPEFAEARAQRLKAHPLGRFGEPEDIGNLVRWLLSDESAFVTGALYAVDGGFTAI